MAEEIKKEGETKENTPPQEENVGKTKGKNTGKTVLIVLLVIFVVIVLCGVGAFFLFRNFVMERVDEVEEITQQIDYYDDDADYTDTDYVIDESEFETEEDEEEQFSDDPQVTNGLESEDLISREFPEDLPLSGGRVVSSSYDQWSVRVDLVTSSTVAEAYDWYVEALEDTDWNLVSQSRDDNNASIEFDNDLDRGDDDFRRGEVSILKYDFRDYTEVTVRERY